MTRDHQLGCTYYVWRNVAFSVSPMPEHHCMPISDYFYLPGSGAEARKLAKHLDGLVDLIINTIPKEEWHGVKRWGNAFGMTGTPTYTSEGAVVYR